MERVLRGKVIVLGDNIDTDQIYPGRYLELVDPKEIGSHCLAGVDENIAPNFVKGDMIVAGSNFGCGSSREHAPISLINMGASVVIADSFARIFYRNSINLGLPLIVCKGISRALKDGDEIEVDIEEGTITLIKTAKLFQGEKIGEYAMNILEAGGIKPLFRERKF
ncbi:MAG: 3-isopropylmalate dehydratase small subunit [Clostridiales bacterium]|nr:3-isopropylmalate dehydratase small subunit [Clostridiales bacterium]